MTCVIDCSSDVLACLVYVADADAVVVVVVVMVVVVVGHHCRIMAERSDLSQTKV